MFQLMIELISNELKWKADKRICNSKKKICLCSLQKIIQIPKNTRCKSIKFSLIIGRIVNSLH